MTKKVSYRNQQKVTENLKRGPLTPRLPGFAFSGPRMEATTRNRFVPEKPVLAESDPNPVISHHLPQLYNRPSDGPSKVPTTLTLRSPLALESSTCDVIGASVERKPEIRSIFSHHQSLEVKTKKRI